MDELLKGIDYLQHNKTKLNNRLSGYSVLVNYNGFIEEEYGTFNQTKDKLEKFYFNKQEKVLGNEILGQTGSHGKVQGTAKIIINISKDKGKFSGGDILVTEMTHPEFVPLMKKAGAIVTDAGGILCHAAIVSRELKIPCIIGTQVATKVLKKGERIRVDAENGTITKL